MTNQTPSYIVFCNSLRIFYCYILLSKLLYGNTFVLTTNIFCSLIRRHFSNQTCKCYFLPFVIKGKGNYLEFFISIAENKI